MAGINVSPGHGTVGRQPDAGALIGHDPGKFGRMFPEDPSQPEDSKLEALAAAMKDEAANPVSVDRDGGELKVDRGDNPRVPAGFTYLGQFVDHDITLDLTALGPRQEDPNATRNFRTPRLDLDALYGLGPDGSPYLYQRRRAAPNAPLGPPGPNFLLGKNRTMDVPAGEFQNDLPRNSQGCALIGDHRNDENLIVAQTHLAFLKFHNKVVAQLTDRSTPPNLVFAEARRIVTWHYQWIVLYDFLERLTEQGIVATILENGRKFYRFETTPYMPVEFSGAAYRLGHSMVREKYSLNRIIDNTDLKKISQITGRSGRVIGAVESRPTDTQEIEAVPSTWIIDWRRWYDFKTPPAALPQPSEPTGPKFVFNFSRKINPLIAPTLHALPDGLGNLAARNLQRGARLKLPCGQEVAKKMKIQNVLAPEQIADSTVGQVAKQHGLHERTPLWYYILREAEERNDGVRLGPVGSTILAEVFVGLVQGDPDSFLCKKKDWIPELPAEKPGTFTMTDLLRFVDEINPIDPSPPGG
jgi:Animal haem peroxidase